MWVRVRVWVCGCVGVWGWVLEWWWVCGFGCGCRGGCGGGCAVGGLGPGVWVRVFGCGCGCGCSSFLGHDTIPFRLHERVIVDMSCPHVCCHRRFHGSFFPSSSPIWSWGTFRPPNDCALRYRKT